MSPRVRIPVSPPRNYVKSKSPRRAGSSSRGLYHPTDDPQCEGVVSGEEAALAALEKRGETTPFDSGVFRDGLQDASVQPVRTRASPAGDRTGAGMHHEIAAFHGVAKLWSDGHEDCHAGRVTLSSHDDTDFVSALSKVLQGAADCPRSDQVTSVCVDDDVKRLLVLYCVLAVVGDIVDGLVVDRVDDQVDCILKHLERRCADQLFALVDSENLRTNAPELHIPEVREGGLRPTKTEDDQGDHSKCSH